MLDVDLRDKVRQWRDDPISFFIEALGVPREYVWSKMIEMCEAVRDKKRVAVKAGHSVSKSYSAARIALWYLYTHYPCTVFTTAPTHNQVEQILWREIRDAKNQALFDLGGKITSTKLELEDKWFAIGFATKPDQGQENATKLQGLHNENFMCIFDEACGVIKPIWEAKEALLTSDNSKFLAIGNPTMASGDFVDCFSDPLYTKITISVLDTPNYLHGREIIPGLSGRDFVESIASKYGENSNQYKSRVLGEIPENSVDSLLNKEWIKSCTESKPTGYPFVKRYVTWDVADGGEDIHVIKSWWNTTEKACVILREKTIEEAEPHVWRALRKIKGNTIVIDADGIGRVAVALLEQSADKDTEIVAFKGSDQYELEKDVYLNWRAYGHWKMRNMFEAREISILKNDEQFEELISIQLMEHKRGLIAIEPKKDIRKRIGRSTNYSDAIMMMCACFEDIKPIIETDMKYRTYEESSGVRKRRFMAV